MTIAQLYEHLNLIYPFKNQDIWDRSGIISYVDIYKTEITKLTISLDINLSVLKYAIENNSNVIISHHPLYIDEKDLKDKNIKQMIQLIKDNNLSIISLHTNFDLDKYGMNYHLLKKIGCKNICRSNKDNYLFFGYLDNKENKFENLIRKIKGKLGVEYIHYMNELDLTKKKKIKIGIVGGAGSSSSYSILKKDKCDIFISSEVKWHIWNYFNEIKNDFVILDVPHSVEKIFIETIIKKINNLPHQTYFPKLLKVA